MRPARPRSAPGRPAGGGTPWPSALRRAVAAPLALMPVAARLVPTALALLLAGGGALAQEAPFAGLATDPEAPVEVAAESLSIDRATGVAVFEGGVVVGQGALRLTADRVEVEYGPERRISRLTATGAVTLASGADAAEAGRAVYDVEAGEILLSEEVLLTQGAAEAGAAGPVLSADRLRLDLATGQAVIEGGVRTVLPVGD